MEHARKDSQGVPSRAVIHVMPCNGFTAPWHAGWTQLSLRGGIRSLRRKRTGGLFQLWRPRACLKNWNHRLFHKNRHLPGETCWESGWIPPLVALCLPASCGEDGNSSMFKQGPKRPGMPGPRNGRRPDSTAERRRGRPQRGELRRTPPWKPGGRWRQYTRGPDRPD